MLLLLLLRCYCCVLWDADRLHTAARPLPPHITARGSTLDANMQDIAVDFYSNQHVLLMASQSRHGFRLSFFVRSRSGICLSNSGKQKATGNCSLSIDRRENMCFACTGEVARSYMNTGYWTRTSYSLCTTWYQLFCNR